MAKLEEINIGEINSNNNYTKEQKAFVEKYKSLFGDVLPSCFEDSDFLSVFMQYVEQDDWKKYVDNTIKYGKEEKVNPEYVLMFRRTTLGQKPKPEVFWTNEYGVVRCGLGKEIPHHSERRILSKIFVTTLGALDEYKQTLEETELIDKIYGYGSSDGEVRISSKPFNLKENCLFAIKPTNEQQELDEYIQRNNLQYE